MGGIDLSTFYRWQTPRHLSYEDEMRGDATHWRHHKHEREGVDLREKNDEAKTGDVNWRN